MLAIISSKGYCVDFTQEVQFNCLEENCSPWEYMFLMSYVAKGKLSKVKQYCKLYRCTENVVELYYGTLLGFTRTGNFKSGYLCMCCLYLSLMITLT